MFYKNDFKQPTFQPRFDYNKNLGQLRKGKAIKRNLEPEVIIKHESDDEDEDVKRPFIVKWFYNFCENTSIHGIKFVGQTELHWSERCMTIFIFRCRLI